MSNQYCKICFNKIAENDIYYFFNKDFCLCKNCMDNLKPKFKNFRIEDCFGLSIFEYDENIKDLLFKLKGCFDIEMATVFLERYKKEFGWLYGNYICIPAPSSEEDDRRRQFNHVIEIFKEMGIPILPCIKKITKHKQSDQSFEQRKEILKYLKIDGKPPIKNKKILIIDDVLTTGSTIKAMISLIKPFKPKKIKVLVMSRTIYKDARTTIKK